MSSGKVNKALRCLSNNLSGGVLALDDMIPDSSNGSTHRTTRDILVEKHPPGEPAQQNYLLREAPVSTNSILFDSLSAESILKAALKTSEMLTPGDDCAVPSNLPRKNCAPLLLLLEGDCAQTA